MKKLLPSVFIIACMLKGAYPQCGTHTPTGVVGVYPPSDSLPCIEHGISFCGVMYLESVEEVEGVTVNWVRIDSIKNLPNGISVDISDSLLQGNQTACIVFSGITTDPVAIDTLDVYVRVNIEGIGIVDGIIGEDPGLMFPPIPEPERLKKPYLRIVDPGASCPASNCVATGIQHAETAHSGVFPNPTADGFTLTLGRSIADFDVQILDVSGKQVHRYLNLSGNTISLNVQELENGIYLYRVVSNGLPVSKGKLVVMR